MKILSTVLAELEATTPPSEAVRLRAVEYLATAQIKVEDLALRLHRDRSDVSRFLNGTYLSKGVALTDVRLRRDLIAFMDAHPIEIDETVEGRLYETSNVKVMRQWFGRCLDAREMAVVYGPPGAQKTFVLRHLMAEHNRRELPRNGHGTRAYYVYCSQNVQPRDLLRRMCRAAAIPAPQTILGLIESIRYHLGKRRVLFVLDEAQHLGIPALEIVRELNDCEPRCGILLSGSHTLMQLFQQRAAELEQWNSRLSNAIALPGITVPEATEIICAELGAQPTDTVKALIADARVTDPFADKKQQGYLSARRLFRSVYGIKNHPEFIRPVAGVPGGKAEA